MKRLYVFITYNLFRTGGTQPYVAAKTEFLSNNGWEVKILYDSYQEKNTIYTALSSLTDGAFPELSYPPFKIYPLLVDRSIRRMKRYILDGGKCSEIYIESHNDKMSQWGELLAREVGGKHFFICMNEFYHLPGQYYDIKNDFYKFKYQRRELFGNHALLQELLKCCIQVDEDIERNYLIAESPVQDIISEKVDALEKADWNICYIGRFSKKYVPSIIEGVEKFAIEHPQSSINFIIVGNTKEKKELLRPLIGLDNLRVIEMGDMIPIPRSLYKKVDVVIAGSGSARCSATEGVLTIVAEANSCKASGLLGYDTKESIYWDGKSPLINFDEALEQTLIEKYYEYKQYDYHEPGVKESCEQNFAVIQAGSKIKEYYGREKMLSGKKSLLTSIKVAISSLLLTISPMSLYKIRRILGNNGAEVSKK